MLLVDAVSDSILLTLFCAVELVASLIVAVLAHVPCWSGGGVAGHHEFGLHSYACSRNSQYVGIADLTQLMSNVVSSIVWPADGVAMVPDP